MASSLAYGEPASIPPNRLLRLPAFWLTLLALLLLGAFEIRLIARCWPAYGESTCSRYSLPLNFLIDLAFLLLAVLVFDQRWWVVLLSGVLAVVVAHAGSLPRLAQNIAGGASLPQSIFPLAGWTFMALYLALPRIILPAAILRWIARITDGLTQRCAFLFGAAMAAFAALYHIVLFGGAALISPGSVASGYIITPLDLAGALLTGIAAWLAVVIGKRVRAARSLSDRLNA